MAKADVKDGMITEHALQTPKTQEEGPSRQQSTHIHKADTVVPDLIKDNAGVSPSGLAEAPSLKGALHNPRCSHTWSSRSKNPANYRKSRLQPA